MVFNRTCERCSQQFMAVVSNKKFCSPDCFNANRQVRAKKSFESRRVSRFCKQCRKEYRRPAEKSGFCSRSCGSKWNIAQGKFELWKNSQKGKRSGEMVHCSECNELTYRVNHQKRQVPFCSLKCKRAYYKQAFSGSGNPMFGKKLSDQALEKQKRTLLQNHGVTNAYFLSKHRSVSKGQQEILSFLTSSFPDAEFEGEKFFSSGTHRYFIDIVSEPLKMIIEFNGDYWHCNPEFYSGSFFHPKKAMTAAQVWEYDAMRNRVLELKGYNVFTVWENDYRRNMSGSLESLRQAVVDGLNG